MDDSPCPYRHNRFPYVPFWNKREDRTGVPYGLARGWMYLQDTVNATLSKLRWGLSAVRTTRTQGAVVDDDNTFRREIARSDADIVLDQKEMAKPGATFKVERDFALTDQQNNMLSDSREGMKRVSAINSSYMGEANQARSGLANSGLVEQASLGQGELFDNFQDSRNEVGTLLMSNIIEEMAGIETTVAIKGTVSQADRVVKLNTPGGDGILTNDVTRVLLKVVLEDVPSSPSYRTQQLQSFTEVFKSTPTEFQRALFPQMLSLMDVPNKDEAVKAVRDAATQPTEDDIKQRIEQAVHDALMKSNADYKTQQLDLERQLNEAKIDKMKAEAVATGTLSAYQAMEAANLIVAAPTLAPIGDEVLKGAGYQVPTPSGVNPGIENALPAGVQQAAPVALPASTHPNFPPHPASPALGAGAGIEGGQQS